MANETKRLSQQGRQNLAHSEAVRRAYYNDQGNNCTFGQGTLVHYGPCTATELAGQVTQQMIDQARNTDIAEAERLVRNAVRAHELTQAQFDAAVSFVCNTGTTQPLRPANQGNMAEVARRIDGYVYVCRRDQHGRAIPGTCQVSAGLVNRRQRETAPFRNAP